MCVIRLSESGIISVIQFLAGRVGPQQDREEEKERWEEEKNWKAPYMGMVMYIALMAMAHKK